MFRFFAARKPRIYFKLNRKTSASTLLAISLGFGLFPQPDQAASKNMQPTLSVYKTLSVGHPVTAVCWSPDGRMLATISNFGQSITIWAADGTILKTMNRLGPYLQNSISFLPKSAKLLTPADAKAGPQFAFTLWNVETGAVDRQIEGPKPEKASTYNTAENFAVDSTGRTVAAIVSLSTEPVTVYSTDNWGISQSIAIDPMKVGQPVSIAISKSGDLLAVGTARGEVLFFDPSSGTERFDPLFTHAESRLISASALAFSPDARLIAAGNGLIFGASDKPIAQDTPPDDAHTPIRVWRVEDHRLVASYSTPTVISPIRQLTWSSDGRHLAATGMDNAVRLFSVDEPTKDPIVLPFEGKAVLSICFSPDGHFLAVAAGAEVKIIAVVQAN